MRTRFQTEVLIVGGGISGLTVARSLNEEGIPAVVLEKDNRVGGRICSSRVLSEAQLGAEFIHGGNRNVLRLLRSLQISTVDYLMDGGDGRFYSEGGVVHTQDSQFARDVEQQYELLHSYQGSDDISVAAYAEQIGISYNGPGYFARARVIRMEAASLSDLSAKGLYQAFRNAGNPDRNYRIDGGFNALLNRLVEEATVVMNADVKRIVWRPGHVTVWIENGSVILARALVLTVPIDSLRNLSATCVPPLPVETNAALQALRMGPAAKVLVHVREGTWPNFSAYATDEPIQVWWNLKHSHGQVLVGFAAGPKTWRISRMTKREIKDQAIADIRRIGGELYSRDIISVEKPVWNKPGKMAYSYIPVGAYTARNSLSESINETIWIAGEAAVVAGLAGTISGAIESAIKVSQAIVDTLKSSAPARIQML